MKLNKKILCAVLTGVMALSSVSAFAAVLPTTKDNAAAFDLMEKFYNDGLYYEAKEVLGRVVNAQQTYDLERKAMWDAKIDEKIEDWEITVLFNQVESRYYASDINGARAALVQIPAYNLEYWQYAKLMSWAEILNAIKYEYEAIVAVENFAGPLDDSSLYYSVVKVANGFDVYVKSYNSSANLAAYNVNATTGAVVVDNTDWEGNIANEINEF